MGTRMSHLPIAQYCGMGPRLSDQYGAGRAAQLSSAFHAICAGADDAEEKTARLTDAERQELMKMHPPEPVEVDGFTLRYEDAAKELEVAIDHDLEPCTADAPGVLSVGHLDMVWQICHDSDSLMVAYVADIKRSEFTVTESTDSLQLHAYGYTYAAANKCDAYCVGIWAAKEGLWQWGEMVRMNSMTQLRKLAAIEAAALNNSEEYAPGSHCMGCWGRSHCQEWLLPPTATSEELAPYAKPGGITDQNSYDLLLKWKRANETLGQIEEYIKAYAREFGIRDGKGKIYKPIGCKGRESSLSPKELREQMGDDAEKYIKRGTPFSSLRWVKE